jgi:hypothetical protein
VRSAILGKAKVSWPLGDDRLVGIKKFEDDFALGMDRYEGQSVSILLFASRILANVFGSECFGVVYPRPSA